MSACQTVSTRVSVSDPRRPRVSCLPIKAVVSVYILTHLATINTIIPAQIRCNGYQVDLCLMRTNEAHETFAYMECWLAARLFLAKSGGTSNGLCFARNLSALQCELQSSGSENANGRVTVSIRSHVEIEVEMWRG